MDNGNRYPGVDESPDTEVDSIFNILCHRFFYGGPLVM